jgi:hypothetical protein
MPTVQERIIRGEYKQNVHSSGLVEMRSIPIVPLSTLFSEGRRSDYPFLDVVRQSVDNHLTLPYLTQHNGNISPHQVRSALAMVGDPDNLSEIIKALLDDPRELEKMEAIKHPLGFTRFTLLTGQNFKLKAHMYGWPQPPDEVVTDNIHDHRFKIAGSRILFGSLQKELFTPSAIADDEYGEDYYMYHQASDSNSLNPVQEARVRHINPAKPTSALHEDDIYTLNGKTFHRVSFDPEEPTATLFLHTVSPRNESNKATVFSVEAKSTEEDYPAIPLSEGAEILEHFLAVLKSKGK